MIDTDLIRSLRDRLLEQGPRSTALGVGIDLERLAPYEQASLARVTPLAELLFLMMLADEEQDDRELTTVRGAVRALTDGLLSGTVADRLVDHFRAELDREGLEARLDAVSGVIAADREDAEVGVMLAAAVALADDRVDDRERALFDQVASLLGIGKRRVEELLGAR